MKKHLFLFVVVLMTVSAVRAQVAINTDGSNPNSSAMLDVKSDTAGILIPRMTAAQRDAISSPAQGLLVYVTDDNTFYFYTGSFWEKVGRGASGWIVYGNYVYVLTDSVGIGTGNITAPLVVKGRIEQKGTGQSVFLGEGAGANSQMTNNHNNVFVGYEAGNANTNGAFNVAVGHRALKSSTDADYNSAVGFEALTSNTNGKRNVAVGLDALNQNTSGDANTALGTDALIMNTTGHSNVAVGVRALYNNTSRNNIVAVGDSALFNNGVGAYQAYHSITNTAIGSKAMFSNTTGYDNTGVGYNVMYYNTTGYENSAFGQSALLKNTTGHWNTAIGFRSLFENTTGYSNTALGFRAGGNATGAGNVFIGYKAGYNETGSNKLYIDNSETSTPLIGGDFSTDQVNVNGVLKVSTGSAADSPQAGMIRWNSTTGDFEGYNGTEWLSLTKSDRGWGDNSAKESQSVVASDGASGDYFGINISIDGDYTIIGAHGKDNGRGKAYIFHYNGSIWTEQQGLTASDRYSNDWFGYRVSIDNDYAIAGAYGKDINGHDNQGKAYIFHYDGSTWAEQQGLTASDGTTGHYFGCSVSIDDDFAIVGAYRYGYGDKGKAYIFHYDGSTWSEQQGLTASDGANYDYFGYSVAIDGDYALIGAYGKDIGSNNNQGKAYIFYYDGSTWSEQAGITSSDGGDGDYFGFSVSINGDYAIVGAEAKDVGSNANQGKAYIFHRNGTTWSEQSGLIAPDGTDDDRFGHTVSIDSVYAVVGAYKKDVGGNSDQGKAYVFYRSGSKWSLETELTSSDGAATDYFGVGVSINNDYIVVGADLKDVGSNSDQGKVYFYKKNN